MSFRWASQAPGSRKIDTGAKAELLFERALDHPPGERAAFLEKACAESPEILRELLSLLPYAKAGSSFFVTPVLQLAMPDVFELFAADPGLCMPEEIGGFCLVRCIGKGGMGVIYEARPKSSGRPVALKLMNPGSATPGLRRRFAAEAQLLGRLDHPGIVRIYEAGIQEIGDSNGSIFRLPFLVMELVKGQRLDHFLSRRPLDLTQRLELFVEICDAVDHAHVQGVIHRDLKPANLLVREDRQPKVVDFGIACRLDCESDDLSRLTATGQVLGSLAYMSPEQLDGDPRRVDARCDVYALGVILYQMLSGRLPYDVRRASIHEAAAVIHGTRPAPLELGRRSWSHSLGEITSRAMKPSLGDRFGSAADLARAVRQFLAREFGRSRTCR